MGVWAHTGVINGKGQFDKDIQCDIAEITRTGKKFPHENPCIAYLLAHNADDLDRGLWTLTCYSYVVSDNVFVIYSVVCSGIFMKHHAAFAEWYDMATRPVISHSVSWYTYNVEQWHCELLVRCKCIYYRSMVWEAPVICRTYYMYRFKWTI